MLFRLSCRKWRGPPILGGEPGPTIHDKVQAAFLPAFLSRVLQLTVDRSLVSTVETIASLIKYILTFIPVYDNFTTRSMVCRNDLTANVFNWSFKNLDQEWGSYLLSWAAWIVHHRWRAAKSNSKIPPFLTMTKRDFSWLTIQVPAKHVLLIMELRFEAMLHSNFGNENCDAGHIKCSRGPQVLHPWSRWRIWWIC